MCEDWESSSPKKYFIKALKKCVLEGALIWYIGILNGGRAHRRRNEGAPDYYCPLLPITSHSTPVHLHRVLLYRGPSRLIALYCTRATTVAHNQSMDLCWLFTGLCFLWMHCSSKIYQNVNTLLKSASIEEMYHT